MTMTRPLRALLIAHGVVTLAAAVALAAVPAAIPATVGIALQPDAFMLSYLLAAAELAIGILSLGAARLNDAAALRLVVTVFVVGFGLGQLVQGPLTDRYGRRPVLIGS